MLKVARALLGLVYPLVLAAGCGSSEEFTSDASGAYTVAITNGASTCSDFMKWTEGEQTSGIPLTITQTGNDLDGTLGGLWGTFFTAVFGSNDFKGSIHGNDVTLTNYGSRSMMSGNCSYTYNANVAATQTGDSISGTITYAPKTNGNPDCSAVECSATQKFSGSRPPK